MKTTIKRIKMYFGDSPYLCNLRFKGVAVKPIGLDSSSDEVEMLVEVMGQYSKEAFEHELVIEVHGTGWPIPVAGQVNYLGTVMDWGFVWHVFYMFRHEQTVPDMEKLSREEKYQNCSVVFKYDLAEEGATDLQIPGNTARPLHINRQHGQLRLWLLQDLIPAEGAETAVSVAALPSGADDGDASLDPAQILECNGSRYLMRFSSLQSK
jgi:hypothetical protein